jgi:serine/threonine-protein kinase
MRAALRYGVDYAERPDRTIEEKISRFRRRFAGWLGVSGMLFVVNAVTGGPPWFIFPVVGMMVPLIYHLGSLWGDGVPLRRVFFGVVRRHAREPIAVGPQPESGDQAAALVTKDVLDGPHGVGIRRAAASRQIINDLLKRMSPREREMLPSDLESTVNALVERVASVASTLHRLDADASGGTLGSLDDRIEVLRRDTRSSEQERRLALLERQRATLHDLLERRTALLSQLESASLALENLRLDLVRFRSAGVSNALEDVTSATREARAVSRDIEHMLEAQDEVRRL